MSKQYRPWTPEQAYLLPPSPLEWLPEGHLAYFLLEVVRELDLSAIEVVIQTKDPRGERPYAPRMMMMTTRRRRARTRGCPTGLRSDDLHASRT